jgi:hypothetical protein
VSANHILQNFLSDGKFVSANHILQNFLSVENFPEWKWALRIGRDTKNLGGGAWIGYIFINHEPVQEVL